jgi:enoyl-[acyl-carrier-protein] reductase (NADH)
VGVPRRGLKRSVPEFAELDAPAIFREVVKRTVPLGRAQTVEDIGHLAAFLASDAARNITGQWIAVDGGTTLRQVQ